MMRRALAGPPCLRPRRNLSRRADMDDRAKLRRRHRWRATSDCSCGPLSCPRVGGLPVQPRGQAGLAREQPGAAQRAQAVGAQLGLAAARSCAAPRRAGDGDADAAVGVHLREPRPCPPRRSSRRAARHARSASTCAGSQSDDLGDDPRRDDRVVADDARREALVRHDEAGVVGRAQPRVREPDVLDGAGDVLDGHEVADPDRLGDGEQDAGDGVGERLARREADDRGGEGAGGEDARRRGGPAPRTARSRPRRRRRRSRPRRPAG